MFWSQIDFFRLLEQFLPIGMRQSKTIAFIGLFMAQLDKTYRETLYKMQHDGRTIYLEKVLNEHFAVSGYDTQNHQGTKKVFIENTESLFKLYIYQDLEPEVTFLKEDNPNFADDVFLDSENENVVSYSWIINIPDTYVFEENNLRALVDQYRYFGKKYIIKTYTL